MSQYIPKINGYTSQKQKELKGMLFESCFYLIIVVLNYDSISLFRNGEHGQRLHRHRTALFRELAFACV